MEDNMKPLIPGPCCAHLDATQLKAISDAMTFEILKWALGQDVPSPLVVTHEGVAYEIDHEYNLTLRWGSENWTPVRSPGTEHLTDDEVAEIKRTIVTTYAAGKRDGNGVCTWKLGRIPLRGVYYNLVVGIDTIMTEEELEVHRAKRRVQ